MFRIGNERFALKATEVAEVLPRLALKPIAQAPLWVAGIFAHRGVLVPVIDLSALTFGTGPGSHQYAPGAGQLPTAALGEARWLGLILEQATDTLRCDPPSSSPMAWTTSRRRTWGRCARMPKA